MPSLTTTSAAGVVALILVGSLAASHASLEATEPFEEQIKQLLETTIRDISVGWLDAKDAYGGVQEGQLHAVDLLVRLSGSATELNLGELVVTTDGGEPVWLEGARVLRDEDGSMAEDRLNQGDLVRLHIVPEEPLPARDTFSLILHHPDKATLEIRLDPPDHPENGQVRLQVQRSW